MADNAADTRADTKKLADPFAKLSGLMTDQKLFEAHRLPDRLPDQPAKVEGEVTQKDFQSPTQDVTQKDTHKATHSSTQVSRQVSKKPSNLASRHVTHRPGADAVEDLAYRLRKVSKVRVNADVPAEWKERLDELAYQLRVGKYELMLYVIAEFLEEAEAPEQALEGGG